MLNSFWLGSRVKQLSALQIATCEPNPSFGFREGHWFAGRRPIEKLQQFLAVEKRCNFRVSLN